MAGSVTGAVGSVTAGVTLASGQLDTVTGLIGNLVVVALVVVLLFVVVLLVGAGWTLLKPLLSNRDKHLIFVVIVLQLIAQSGIIVVDEIAPGSSAYNAWRTVLHVADIICCCIVLFPIIWSIQSLQAAAAADGKARDSLNRLLQFRTFYLMTVVYIYFSRVFVYLMLATLEYRSVWVAYFFDEFAALLFYATLGFMFRPDAENPYLRVASSEDEDGDDDEEFGLDSADGIDTTRAAAAGASAMPFSASSAATGAATGASSRNVELAPMTADRHAD
jgi:hypothetical protein